MINDDVQNNPTVVSERERGARLRAFSFIIIILIYYTKLAISKFLCKCV